MRNDMIRCYDLEEIGKESVILQFSRRILMSRTELTFFKKENPIRIKKFTFESIGQYIELFDIWNNLQNFSPLLPYEPK